MRFRTQWFYGVVGVFTLTTILCSIPATKSLAQASLFDPTFHVGYGANGTVYSVVIQDDGKIIVGGEFTQIAGQARTNLARLNNNGQLDDSFPQGTDGVVYRLLKQPDAKILVGGTFTNLQGVARQRLGRLLTNGLVDVGFDAGANVATELAVFSLAYQSDGKILLGIVYPPEPNSTSYIKRLESDGGLDAAFTQTNVFQDSFIAAICARTDGTILIGGGFQRVNNLSSPALAVINTNGEFDLSFSSPLTTNSLGYFSSIFSLVNQPDNSVLMGGKFWQKHTAKRFAVARLTPILTWDASFVADEFDPIHGEETLVGWVRHMVQQPDGKLVVGGLFQEVGGYWRRDIVRLDSQGRVDACFDPGIGLGDEYFDGNAGVLTVASQPDGNIVAGGKFLNFAGGAIASIASSNLVRFLPLSECNATRVHLLNHGSGHYTVIGTCAPGGTNYLQQSTNLVDWYTLGTNALSGSYLDDTVTTRPYVFWFLPSGSTTNDDSVFFRVKKGY